MVPVPGGYCIDATEVTNAQYATFLAANFPTSGQDGWCAWNTTYTPSTAWPATGKDANPVVYVDWCDAYAYCKWAGKHLCGKIGGGANDYGDYAFATKSEWYNACSGGGAQAYPYGNTYDAAKCNGCKSSTNCTTTTAIPAGTALGCEGGYPGLFDMSGNVNEWENSCDGQTGANDNCLMRGGAFNNNNAYGYLKCAVAGWYSSRSATYATHGFRCCSVAL